MRRFRFFVAALAVMAALVLSTLPVSAQIIPKDEDRWVTPNNGSTFFIFPAGDVESLCNVPVSFSWNRRVNLTGVPEPGHDWDTVVARLKDADVSSGFATVPIQVKRLVFKSIAEQSTPCGKLSWLVEAVDHQPVTKMDIHRTTDKGGIFKALISVRVAFTAFDARGTAIGRLFYTMDLPDNAGVPWSFDGSGTFRPGIDEDENCIDVLRQKLTTATGDHVYYIENLIAQGKCDKRPN